MSFTQLAFAILLGIVAIMWVGLRQRYWPTLTMLLAASIVFYGHNRWWLMALILIYSVVDWLVALVVEKSPRPLLPLTIGISFNLAVLCYWKYTPTLLQTAALVAGWVHLPEPSPAPVSWAIPLGISFYSFTGIAYMVDVYRGEVRAERNFIRFAFFISFFAHLMAGPILRAREFLANIQPDTFPTRPQAPLEALVLTARGYFKKMVLADRIGLAIDPFFAHVADSTTVGVWSLPYVYLYALQIYLDFSGYTDIARGLALWFGFRWPENFNLPYFAGSIHEFWRRWHITLSAFLRDYLYIPLGGNRCGKLRSLGNLMLTMLLGGLWHGSQWTFLVWGGMHGLFLSIHRLWSNTKLRKTLVGLKGFQGVLWKGLMILLTFHAVCLGWCFFRITNLHASWVCVKKWFLFDRNAMLVGGSADSSLWTVLGLYAFGALLSGVATRGQALDAIPNWLADKPFLRGAVWGGSLSLIFLAIVMAPGGEKPPFIYFQF